MQLNISMAMLINADFTANLGWNTIFWSYRKHLKGVIKHGWLGKSGKSHAIRAWWSYQPDMF